MASTIRLYFDALIAVGLMSVIALLSGFIAALVIGGSPPHFPTMSVAFLLTGAFLFLRLWSKSRVVDVAT